MRYYGQSIHSMRMHEYVCKEVFIQLSLWSWQRLSKRDDSVVNQHIFSWFCGCVQTKWPLEVYLSSILEYVLSFCCNSVKLLRPGLCTAWVPSKWVPERSSQLLRHNHTLSTPRRVSNILQRGTATKPSCGQLVPDQIFTLRSRVRRKAAPLHRCSRKNHFKERAHERNWLFLKKRMPYFTCLMLSNYHWGSALVSIPLNSLIIHII